MLNFDFSEKGLGIDSPTHFAYDFSRKVFLIFHCLIAFTCEIMGNMCIAIFVSEVVTSYILKLTLYF